MKANEQGPVVVGTDGTSEATRAALYGAWEAQRRAVPLRLVFAHQPPPAWGPAALVPDDYTWIHGTVRDILVQAEKDVAAVYPEVVVETAVVVGGAGSVLVDESKRASLVVLGTRASGGLLGHVTGSVAAQVAAHSHAPVVVLRPTGSAVGDANAPSVKPVVVGLDGSPASERAFSVALEAAAARHSELHVVFVDRRPDVDGIGAIVADYRAAEEDALALQLVTRATDGRADRYPDVVVTHVVVHATDAVEALAQASAEADLIVVGTRGRGGFLGLRLGSTSDGLIRTAATTVLVVPTA